MWTDKHPRKRYLHATSFAGGKKYKWQCSQSLDLNLTLEKDDAKLLTKIEERTRITAIMSLFLQRDFYSQTAYAKPVS